MKKILFSLAVVVAVGAVIAGATGAFLSDTETSSGNTFSAGAIDLKIDNESYYNNAFNPGTSWELDDLDGTGHLFFNFLDLKPGDEGEDTISIHVDDNDAWACMDIALTANEDNGSTEPELDDEDPYTGDVGELAEAINFIWWKDDGDNVLEQGEEDESVIEATLAGLNGFALPLADISGNALFGDEPLEGSQTYYIGKAWCFGSMTINPLPEGDGSPADRPENIECDGENLNNDTQTDTVVLDISFEAEQSRHNPDFRCNGGGFGCEEKADVMLVIDRSGSINSTELATMKTAAKAFVDALAPSTDGVHMGLASFASAAALDQALTSDGTAVKTAIDALVSGGSTNLGAGIDTADAELTGVNDRADAPNIIVVITDGAPNVGSPDGPTAGTNAATNAKTNGAEIFVVGVGTTGSTATYVEDNIESDDPPQHYFDAANFSDLSTVLAGLIECEEEPE